MDVALIEAPPDAEPILERLMQLYAYDFSELARLDVGEDGRFRGGPPLASCWSEPWRHAYLVRVALAEGESPREGRIAGFTILDERSRLTGDRDVADVAEFLVLRRYRRLGVGMRAAAAAFSLFPRRWEVRQTTQNKAATAFWRRAIASYVGEAFTETVVDDERWRGTVHRFDARARLDPR